MGRYVAEASLWAVIVNMLALFRFEPAPGWDPGEKGENVIWTEGVTTWVYLFLDVFVFLKHSCRHPKFPCKITPRHGDLNKERLLQLVQMAA